MAAERAALERKISALNAALSRRSEEAAAKELQLERYAADLRDTFKEERERRRELQASYVATVRALSNAVEARDAYTGKHAERVTAYGLLVAQIVQPTLATAAATEFGFLLHDIGKLAIPDAILFKPGPLSDSERTLMARHPVIGAELLQRIDFLTDSVSVVRHHHERWDGSGYPDHLRGDEIPLVARVFAVGDVYDALTTDRPYRVASPTDEARRMIHAAAGTHFDPEVVAAFDAIPDERLAQVADSIR
jgi:cyclic di-GMP phosphodiesterase